MVSALIAVYLLPGVLLMRHYRLAIVEIYQDIEISNPIQWVWANFVVASIFLVAWVLWPLVGLAIALNSKDSKNGIR